MCKILCDGLKLLNFRTDIISDIFFSFYQNIKVYKNSKKYRFVKLPSKKLERLATSKLAILY